MIKKMLYQKSDVFSTTDDDIGKITDLKVDIQLTDNIPLQTSYVSIPRPL